MQLTAGTTAVHKINRLTPVLSEALCHGNLWDLLTYKAGSGSGSRFHQISPPEAYLELPFS